MSILPLVLGAESPILRDIARPVVIIDKHMARLIKNMKETMIHANGIGLAAPQINESWRIIICRFDFDTKQERITALINPEITWSSDETDLAEEGCLSLPEVFGKVIRPTSIHVKFLNEKGREQHLEYTGMNARIIQHEIDHLDGILFTDYISGKANHAEKKL